MIKQCGHYITFQEVPNEVSLTFTISNCQHHCLGCHSPWLQTDIGDELTIEDIKYYINQYQGAITCVCFMGTGDDFGSLSQLIEAVHKDGYKVCVYSGDDDQNLIDAWAMYDEEPRTSSLHYLPDYFKYGSYQAELGGLDHPTTNQRMLKRKNDGYYEDITAWFWRKKE